MKPPRREERSARRSIPATGDEGPESDYEHVEPPRDDEANDDTEGDGDGDGDEEEDADEEPGEATRAPSPSSPAS